MTKKKLKGLDKILENHRTILIVAHDYPDPDALTCAMLLSHLACERYGMRTRIAYGGHINRAENRAMVQQLGIKMTHVDKIRWQRYSCIAIVDTQPGFGNQSLPEKIRPTIVIDHHAKKTETHVQFEDIRTDYGACATILLEYLLAAELELPVDLATAVTYAIRSETDELGRDASQRDVDAYLQVYPKANKRKLARIFNPKLPRAYFRLLKTALQNARVFRHLAHVHLSEVESPEFVAQTADFLLRQERITWTLATGRFDGHLFISLRTSHGNANAGKMLRHIVGRSGSAGGHAMAAGGQIEIDPDKDDRWQKVEDSLVSRFAKKLNNNKEADWKAMLLPAEPEA